MELKIQDEVVVIKDSLTWGDSQKIQGALMGGAKMSGKTDNIGFDFDASVMLEAKYVALECAVVEIVQKNELKVEFSREWMDNLSLEDGDKLFNAVDKLSKKNE
jgi:hypothetical protein